MLLTTEYGTMNTTIVFLDNDEVLKAESHSMQVYPGEEARYQSHIYSYYTKGNLVAAQVVSPCRIESIQVSVRDEHISFTECGDLSLMTHIDKNSFSRKAIKKADKYWSRQY